MSLPLYAKISIGVISVVLIATVALVVITITTNKDKSPTKPPTMQEWMTSLDGVNTLTKALSSLDNKTTFRFNTTGNAKTADKATNSTNWNPDWKQTVQEIKVNNAGNSDNLSDKPISNFVQRGQQYDLEPCTNTSKKIGSGFWVDQRWQSNFDGGGCTGGGILKVK